MQAKAQSKIDVETLDGGQLRVVIAGDAVQQDTSAVFSALQRSITPAINTISFAAENLKTWDSSLLLLIYNIKLLCNDNKINCDLSALSQNLQDLIALSFSVDRKPPQKNGEELSALEKVGKNAVNLWSKIADVWNFIGSVCQGIGRVLTFKSVMRKIDFWTALEDCGPKAIGIVCLISFLVGLILAFVGAVQLQTFGAQIYVASLVTIGMCRIMGAIMVGIIMSGRTGSSYAASIGTMQVNEELDALQTMGLSRIDFLVLPRLFALLIAMPILTLIADFLGMIGGAFVGVLMMDLPYLEYWKYAFNAFYLNNFLVGIFHGFCFGIIIALCGCYSGLKCGRNADSVGKATTQSVVCAIVWMIVVTGIITMICLEFGI